MFEKNLNCSWKLLNSDGSPSTIFFVKGDREKRFLRICEKKGKMQTIAENEDRLAAEKGAKGYRQVVELYHDEPNEDSYFMTMIMGI